MRVTKIDKPAPVYRKALGYDPDIPDGDVEEPVFEGAFVLIPRDNSGIEFVPAPTVTDGDLDTYAETDAHDEAMRITLDFASRFVRIEVLGAWETSVERTYTLEAGNAADFSDAIELDSQTFTAPAAFDPYEIVFEYDSLPTAYQYYRLIGPDEERRWHNLRLIPASVDGCECIELCRDPEGSPELLAAADSGAGAQTDPIDLGEDPPAGSLWLVWTAASSLTGFDLLGGPLVPPESVSSYFFSREAEEADDGSITVGAGTHWITAAFGGVDTTAAVVEELDAQTTPPGGDPMNIDIDVPAGPHLVVAYFSHDNTLEPTIQDGWDVVKKHAAAGTKWQLAISALVDGGDTYSPGVNASAAGNWIAFAAAFAAGEAPVIVGGPNATQGVANCASPGDHDHATVAPGGATGEVLAKASDTDYDTEWVAAGGGAPTTADYLVGTANGSLSSEIVVGTTPGGELGGTWASPTVDATHSGSTHSAATDTHIADATDAHDASAISIVDTGGHYTSTDVEGALQEAAEASGDPSEDTHVWMPLTTVVGGEPELVWEDDNSLIPTLVPLA